MGLTDLITVQTRMRKSRPGKYDKLVWPEHGDTLVLGEQCLLGPEEGQPVDDLEVCPPRQMFCQ